MAIDPKANPANEPPKTTAIEADRIPMTVPTQRLSAPDIPGFHLHWFMGAPDRIHQALRAGYTFVEDHEVGLSNRDLAGDGRPMSGTDMGTRVSVAAGGTYEGDSNTAARLYLMKLPLELYEKDQAALAAVNERIAATLRGDQGFEVPGGDNSNRYRPETALPRGKKRAKTLFDRKDI